jgi:CRP-like cAMP-binding protein
MDLLAELDPAVARHVLSGSRRNRFKRNEVIFREGDPADCVHLIAVGRIAVRVTTASGYSATLDIVGAGGVIGEQALLPGGGVRSATAIALERVDTIKLGASTFAELRREHVGIDDFLLSMLATRNRTVTRRLMEALYVSTETRVLRRLIDLVGLYGSDGDSEVVVTFTQEDLAGLAGTTRETVNRVLRGEAEQGSIELGRGRIRIRDLAGLTKRAHIDPALV